MKVYRDNGAFLGSVSNAVYSGTNTALTISSLSAKTIYRIGVTY